MTIGQSFEEAVAAAERARTAPPPDGYEPDVADVYEAECAAIKRVLLSKGTHPALVHGPEVVMEAIAEDDHLDMELAELCAADDPDEAEVGRRVIARIRGYAKDIAEQKGWIDEALAEQRQCRADDYADSQGDE